MLSNDDDETLPPVSLSDEDDEIEGIMNGVSFFAYFIHFAQFQHKDNAAPASLVLNSHPELKAAENSKQMADIPISDDEEEKRPVYDYV